MLYVARPPKESFLKNSPRGPFGLSGSLLPYVIFGFLCFPLGTRVTYCDGWWWVVGGAYGVFGDWRILAYLAIGVFWRILAIG